VQAQCNWFHIWFNKSVGSKSERLVQLHPSLTSSTLTAGQSNIKVNCPVIRIEQRHDYESENMAEAQELHVVQVTTQDNTVYRCKFVVVAVPVAVLNKIDIHPPLPASRHAICQSLAPASQIKTLTLYEKPFWRESNSSGVVLSNGASVRYVHDASITLSDGRQVYALAGHFIGNTALHWSEYSDEVGTTPIAVEHRLYDTNDGGLIVSINQSSTNQPINQSMVSIGTT
jgi:monoamine oxidase